MLFDPKWQKAEIKPVSDLKALLLKAADLMEERGIAKWIQQDDDGRLCVHGAISIAHFGRVYQMNQFTMEAVEAVGKHVGLRKPYADLAGWNNSGERTLKEVVTALRETAERV